MTLFFSYHSWRCHMKAKRMQMRVILGLWDMKSVCIGVFMFPSKVDDKIF
jgi:hypothetical protein